MSETRQQVERLFGREQALLARPSIKSVIDRQDYARYHYQEVRALLSEFASVHLQNRILLDVSMAQDDARLAFETVMTKLGAHLVACVQSVHSIPDILAHVFYYALGLNLQHGLDERAISAASVRKLLDANPRYGELADALRGLTSDGQARHLAALANHSKHRSIVQPMLNEDWTGEREDRHEVRFAPFIYSDVPYPEIAVAALLEPEYARSSQVTIKAGEKLNQVLRDLAPQCSD
jgi:hypothetical protein